MTNILEIQNVEKSFTGGVRALDGITFSVPKGSIFGYVGLNGAGKTTTIRIIAGLDSVDRGEVRYAGEVIAPGSVDCKRTMGFVLDEPLYFDWMSPVDYFAFVGTMYGLDAGTLDVRVSELNEYFSLAERRHEPIRTFSTGMKKKVSLAAALIHGPELLILDEPLEGIDAVASRSIRESLLFMAARGTTIFITSHVLDTIERLCSEVAIVDRGRIMLQCRMDEIRSRVKDTITKETYTSLEDLFVDLTGDKHIPRRLSWL